MQELLIESFEAQWEALVRLAPRVGASLLVLAVFWLLGRLVGRVIQRLLERRPATRIHARFFRGFVVGVFVLLGIAVGLGVVGLHGVAAGLMAGGGLATVVAAFAFRQIGENLLCGLFLAFGRPFDVGNVIRSGGFEGEVRSVTLRYTHVRTADGRDVFIPNAGIFNDPLENLTRDGLRRAECRIGIDYGDDAEDALRRMAEVVSGVEGVLAEPEPSGAVRELAAATVELSVLFWVDVFATDRGVRAIQGECNESVRRALMGAGFTVSSNVSTAVDLRVQTPVDVRTAAL